MWVGRVLPPILQEPSPPTYVPPVATFFNIPRRYAKSSMQVGDNASLHISDEGIKSPRSLRKSSRIHELRSSATTSPVQHTKENQLPSPAPSSPRVGTKRMAHFDVEANEHDTLDSESHMDRRVSSSAGSTASGELSGHICLCPPERKIPRPRNAFILYRQSQQHEILARRPGVANPEISKIIGEQWKAESDDVKKYWQDLAQAEKRVHHEKYPDYRYQPRRQGKPGSIPPNTPAHTTIEKYRCPRCGGRSLKTSTSPFPSSTLTPTLPPPNPSAGLTPTTRYLPIMSNISVESAARRRIAGPSAAHSIQVPPSAREDPPIYTPMTPDGKRRRLNIYPSSNNGRRPDGPHYSQNSRRGSLPPIQMRYSPPSTATTPALRTPRDARRGSIDLNLLVPNPHDQSRSVEAMVMSVPYAVKIKVLGRITPALKEPGPSSPAVSVRGAIIAVEGDDIVAAKELATWLQDLMAKDGEFAPRLLDAPQAPASDDVSFKEYLDLIREWHARSKDMVKYITTPLTPCSSNPSSSDKSSSSDEDADKESDTKDTKDKVHGTPMSKSASPPPISPASAAASVTSSPRPVIILPTYQLRAADAYASKIPIQDVYSPMDHWQWMATLWRGTVGPDLTIYVKSEPGTNGKVVELSEEGRCLTVVKEKGGRFAEAALRRVGFEVGEWVRGVAGRVG